MDNNIRIAFVVIIGLALTMGAGCATSKVWISSPVAQAAGNPFYEAKIEPLKNGIHLVIRQNGKEIIEKMSVNIEEKVAQ